MFKCEFVGADALVPNELRIYYCLLYVYWVKAFVMEVSMSISGNCIYASVYIGTVKRNSCENLPSDASNDNKVQPRT